MGFGYSIRKSINLATIFRVGASNGNIMINLSFLLLNASFILLAFLSLGSSSMEVERRAPFNAWAGKRSSPDRAEISRVLQDLSQYLRPLRNSNLEATTEKRNTPFNSWAGKRAPFNSWAGKRSYMDDGGNDFQEEEDLGASRYKRGASEDNRRYTKLTVPFSAWGGKRMGNRVARNVDYPSYKVMRPVRAVFSAWGGK